MGRGVGLPRTAKNVERVSADAVKAVVGTAHDELHAAGQGAELADDQPVPELRPVEEDVVPLKGGGVYRIIVIRVIAHENIRGRDGIFQKAGRVIGVGK